MATSPTSVSSVDRHFLEEEEQRAREEIEKFEALEKQFASNRHGIRVKFAYSLDDGDNEDDDDDRLFPMRQTTVVRTEPYFRIQSSEDQVTKHFYDNPFHVNQQPLIRQCSPATPSEPDSLEEETHFIFPAKVTSFTSLEQRSTVYSSASKRQSRTDSQERTDGFDPISSCSSLLSPGKSILKKSSKKDERSSTSRSPSPCSPKRKPNVSDSNELTHLAEMTAKQTVCSANVPFRSLFEPTMNIFDSSPPNPRRRPSRLRYYIKPYRGEANLPSEMNSKQRSRSLSEQRLGQPSGKKPRWLTFSNHYARPSMEQANRKQHVSWSPVREYIHQGREKYIRSPAKR